MKVFVGLGNPSIKYSNSRHNLGFLVIDRISKKNSISVNKKKFRSLIGEGRISKQKVLLVKPQTYMNLSGDAVNLIIKALKIDLDDLLVICDDVNLPEGFIRIRPSGSAGSHKGLESIIKVIGSEDFPRLRIGIGTTGEKAKDDLASFVLRSMGRKSRKFLDQSLDTAEEACYLWLREGIIASMNKFNTKIKYT